MVNTCVIWLASEFQRHDIGNGFFFLISKENSAALKPKQGQNGREEERKSRSLLMRESCGSWLQNTSDEVIGTLHKQIGFWSIGHTASGTIGGVNAFRTLALVDYFPAAFNWHWFQAAVIPSPAEQRSTQLFQASLKFKMMSTSEKFSDLAHLPPT